MIAQEILGVCTIGHVGIIFPSSVVRTSKAKFLQVIRGVVLNVLVSAGCFLLRVRSSSLWMSSRVNLSANSPNPESKPSALAVLLIEEVSE